MEEKLREIFSIPDNGTVTLEVITTDSHDNVNDIKSIIQGIMDSDYPRNTFVLTVGSNLISKIKMLRKVTTS